MDEIALYFKLNEKLILFDNEEKFVLLVDNTLLDNIGHIGLFFSLKYFHFTSETQDRVSHKTDWAKCL